MEAIASESNNGEISEAGETNTSVSDLETQERLKEVHTWWEIPAIAHFCSLFKAVFGFTDFDIEDLEEALITSPALGGSTLVIDLICQLLNGCYARDDIKYFNYDLFLKDIFKQRWQVELGRANPMIDTTFLELSVRKRVEVLHALCDFRLDADDVAEMLKGLSGESLRVEPLGTDRKGCKYWYFYGTRLYKEAPDPERRKGMKGKRKAKQEKTEQDEIEEEIEERQEEGEEESNDAMVVKRNPKLSAQAEVVEGGEEGQEEDGQATLPGLEDTEDHSEDVTMEDEEDEQAEQELHAILYDASSDEIVDDDDDDADFKVGTRGKKTKKKKGRPKKTESTEPPPPQPAKTDERDGRIDLEAVINAKKKKTHRGSRSRSRSKGRGGKSRSRSRNTDKGEEGEEKPKRAPRQRKHQETPPAPTRRSKRRGGDEDLELVFDSPVAAKELKRLAIDGFHAQLSSRSSRTNTPDSSNEALQRTDRAASLEVPGKQPEAVSDSGEKVVNGTMNNSENVTTTKGTIDNSEHVAVTDEKIQNSEQMPTNKNVVAPEAESVPSSVETPVKTGKSRRKSIPQKRQYKTGHEVEEQVMEQNTTKQSIKEASPVQPEVQDKANSELSQNSEEKKPAQSQSNGKPKSEEDENSETAKTEATIKGKVSSEVPQNSDEAQLEMAVNGECVEKSEQSAISNETSLDTPEPCSMTEENMTESEPPANSITAVNDTEVGDNSATTISETVEQESSESLPIEQDHTEGLPLPDKDTVSQPSELKSETVFPVGSDLELNNSKPSDQIDTQVMESSEAARLEEAMEESEDDEATAIIDLEDTEINESEDNAGDEKGRDNEAVDLSAGEWRVPPSQADEGAVTKMETNRQMEVNKEGGVTTDQLGANAAEKCPVVTTDSGLDLTNSQQFERDESITQDSGTSEMVESVSHESELTNEKAESDSTQQDSALDLSMEKTDKQSESHDKMPSSESAAACDSINKTADPPVGFDKTEESAADEVDGLLGTDKEEKKEEPEVVSVFMTEDSGSNLASQNVTEGGLVCDTTAQGEDAKNSDVGRAEGSSSSETMQVGSNISQSLDELTSETVVPQDQISVSEGTEEKVLSETEGQSEESEVPKPETDLVDKESLLSILKLRSRDASPHSDSPTKLGDGQKEIQEATMASTTEDAVHETEKVITITDIMEEESSENMEKKATVNMVTAADSDDKSIPKLSNPAEAPLKAELVQGETVSSESAMEVDIVQDMVKDKKDDNQTSPNAQSADRTESEENSMEVVEATGTSVSSDSKADNKSLSDSTAETADTPIVIVSEPASDRPDSQIGDDTDIDNEVLDLTTPKTVDQTINLNSSDPSNEGGMNLTILNVPTIIISGPSPQMFNDDSQGPYSPMVAYSSYTDVASTSEDHVIEEANSKPTEVRNSSPETPLVEENPKDNSDDSECANITLILPVSDKIKLKELYQEVSERSGPAEREGEASDKTETFNLEESKQETCDKSETSKESDRLGKGEGSGTESSTEESKPIDDSSNAGPSREEHVKADIPKEQTREEEMETDEVEESSEQAVLLQANIPPQLDAEQTCTRDQINELVHAVQAANEEEIQDLEERKTCEEPLPKDLSMGGHSAEQIKENDLSKTEPKVDSAPEQIVSANEQTENPSGGEQRQAEDLSMTGEEIEDRQKEQKRVEHEQMEEKQEDVSEKSRTQSEDETAETQRQQSEAEIQSVSLSNEDNESQELSKDKKPPEDSNENEAVDLLSETLHTETAEVQKREEQQIPEDLSSSKPPHSEELLHIQSETTSNKESNQTEDLSAESSKEKNAASEKDAGESIPSGENKTEEIAQEANDLSLTCQSEKPTSTFVDNEADDLKPPSQPDTTATVVIPPEDVEMEESAQEKTDQPCTESTTAQTSVQEETTVEQKSDIDSPVKASVVDEGSVQSNEDQVMEQEVVLDLSNTLSSQVKEDEQTEEKKKESGDEQKEQVEEEMEMTEGNDDKNSSSEVVEKDVTESEEKVEAQEIVGTRTVEEEKEMTEKDKEISSEVDQKDAEGTENEEKDEVVESMGTDEVAAPEKEIEITEQNEEKSSEVVEKDVEGTEIEKDQAEKNLEATEIEGKDEVLEEVGTDTEMPKESIEIIEQNEEESSEVVEKADLGTDNEDGNEQKEQVEEAMEITEGNDDKNSTSEVVEKDVTESEEKVEAQEIVGTRTVEEEKEIIEQNEEDSSEAGEKADLGTDNEEKGTVEECVATDTTALEEEVKMTEQNKENSSEVVEKIIEGSEIEEKDDGVEIVDTDTAATVENGPKSMENGLVETAEHGTETAEHGTEAVENGTDVIENGSELMAKAPAAVENGTSTGEMGTDTSELITEIKSEDDIKPELKTEQGSDDEDELLTKPCTERKVKDVPRGVPLYSELDKVSMSRWQLVCDSVDDWAQLVEGLQESKMSREKVLHRILKNDFLPEIPSIMADKEKARQRRAREMMPKRSSYRLELKKQEEEEKERQIQEAEEEEEKKRAQAEEERRQQMKEMEEKRLQEEKEKAREERANRARLREERARLIAEGKELPPELANGLRHDDNEQDDVDEELQYKLEKVLLSVKRNEHSWPFLEAVEEVNTPDFFEVIKEPMDLLQIERKVAEKGYKSEEQFERDMNLVFDNCIQYHGTDSDFGYMAENLKGVFERSMRRVFRVYVEPEMCKRSLEGPSSYAVEYGYPRPHRTSRKRTTYRESDSDSEEEWNGDKSTEGKDGKEMRPRATWSYRREMLGDVGDDATSYVPKSKKVIHKVATPPKPVDLSKFAGAKFRYAVPMLESSRSLPKIIINEYVKKPKEPAPAQQSTPSPSTPQQAATPGATPKPPVRVVKISREEYEKLLAQKKLTVMGGNAQTGQMIKLSPGLQLKATAVTPTTPVVPAATVKKELPGTPLKTEVKSELETPVKSEIKSEVKVEVKAEAGVVPLSATPARLESVTVKGGDLSVKERLRLMNEKMAHKHKAPTPYSNYSYENATMINGQVIYNVAPSKQGAKSVFGDGRVRKRAQPMQSKYVCPDALPLLEKLQKLEREDSSGSSDEDEYVHRKRKLVSPPPPHAATPPPVKRVRFSDDVKEEAKSPDSKGSPSKARCSLEPSKPSIYDKWKNRASKTGPKNLVPHSERQDKDNTPSKRKLEEEEEKEDSSKRRRREEEEERKYLNSIKKWRDEEEEEEEEEEDEDDYNVPSDSGPSSQDSGKNEFIQGPSSDEDEMPFLLEEAAPSKEPASITHKRSDKDSAKKHPADTPVVNSEGTIPSVPSPSSPPSPPSPLTSEPSTSHSDNSSTSKSNHPSSLTSSTVATTSEASTSKESPSKSLQLSGLKSQLAQAMAQKKNLQPEDLDSPQALSPPTLEPIDVEPREASEEEEEEEMPVLVPDQLPPSLVEPGSDNIFQRMMNPGTSS